MLTQVTSAIGEGSSAVISSSDQWEVTRNATFISSRSPVFQVFNDSNASDPTHSVLSKVCSTFMLMDMALILTQDHFGIILNEPAGKVAKVVVEHTVGLIVQVCHTNTMVVLSVVLNLDSIEGLVGRLKSRRCHQQGT